MITDTLNHRQGDKVDVDDIQKMDPLASKAHRKFAASTSKASSKGSSRKARNKTKRKGGKTQNAGQPTGPRSGVSKSKERSQRSKSKRISEEEEVEVQSRSSASAGSAEEVEVRSSARSRSGRSRNSKESGSCCAWHVSVRKWFVSWCGCEKKKKTDDLVVFDDNASLESALLWSKDGGQPTSDDYLEFVPEHERGLSNFGSKVSLPVPPEDRVDY